RRPGVRVLSRGRGRALAYRSAPHHLDPPATDAAGQRLARNPLPRATRTPLRVDRLLARSFVLRHPALYVAGVLDDAVREPKLDLCRRSLRGVTRVNQIP